MGCECMDGRRKGKGRGGGKREESVLMWRGKIKDGLSGRGRNDGLAVNVWV